jgi:hypothetical protein
MEGHVLPEITTPPLLNLVRRGRQHRHAAAPPDALCDWARI